MIYTYVICRVDIGYAVTKLASYSDRPAACHYRAVKRVFRNLRQTNKWGLIYWRRTGRNDQLPGDEKLATACKDLPNYPYPVDPYNVVGLVYASHANNLKNRRSTTGVGLTLGGTVTAYQTKRPGKVATSSTEA